MVEQTASTGETPVPALARWVRRVWAGDVEPGVGTPGTDGWLSAALPFSFRYGGRPSAELLPTWSGQAVAREEEGRSVLTLRLSDPATGLAVTWEATLDAELPAVEWLLTFRNDGPADTPPIEDVRALDLVAATDWHELVVHHATGGIAAPDAFEPQQTVLPRPPSSRAPGATGKGGQTELRLAPTGGRSSNGVLPYFNVEAHWGGARGIVVGVGWSGQWEARVARFGSRPAEPRQPDFRGPNPGQAALRQADRLRIEAGMEEVHIALHPGEEIRSPRVLLIPWTDDRTSGQNQLRRYLYRRAPALNGEPPQPALFCNVGIVEPDGAAFGAGYSYEELAGLAGRLGADHLVVDAGWYAVPTDGGVPPERAWVHGVGNYSVRPDVFPGGLRALADTVRRAGLRLGLWFEPERVVEGTEVHREHRDWLFETPLGHGRVFNLGIPAARRWLTDTVSRLIDELGIGWYRHDANANYLPVWRAADPPDRRGISEIRHVEGLYAFWRDLLERHPGLHVDGCASGGRRMDFEALRHHHGQTHTDWLCTSPVRRAATPDCRTRSLAANAARCPARRVSGAGATSGWPTTASAPGATPSFRGGDSSTACATTVGAAPAARPRRGPPGNRARSAVCLRVEGHRPKPSSRRRAGSPPGRTSNTRRRKVNERTSEAGTTAGANAAGPVIPVVIDHRPYKAPKSPMTGAELRVLAQPPIGAARDLWREVPGPGDDVRIGDADQVALHPGMHFYSAPRTIDPGCDRAPA